MFTKDRFLNDLFSRVDAGNNSVETKASAIAERVYSIEKSLLSEADLDEVPDYKELLRIWGYTSVNAKQKTEYRAYIVRNLGTSWVRTKYYAWQKDKNTFPGSLENIVSICLACGMDFNYIRDAVNAYSDEKLEGKGLRKMLLYGAAKGFIGFDEIACQYKDGRYHFGLMEEYYGKMLQVAEGGADALPTVENGTLTFLRKVEHCRTRQDFLDLLEDRDIQMGFLYDMVELVRHIQNFLDKRRWEPTESDNSLFTRFNAKSLRAHYSKICHGHRPKGEWMLCFVLAFRFDSEEIKTIIRSLHLNDAQHKALLECYDTVSECNAAYGDMEKYRSIIAALPDRRLSTGCTVAESVKEFAAFLKLFAATLN